jgi:3-hydroxyisobutyrate dehydrogenase-like beta-hydroxyacid dehydrogenase
MGRPDAAAAARLNILAAGPDAAIEAVQPLLTLMGQKVWRLGVQAPRANVAKLAVNFLLASAVETLGEAAVLAGAYGIAAQQRRYRCLGPSMPMRRTCGDHEDRGASRATRADVASCGQF